MARLLVIAVGLAVAALGTSGAAAAPSQGTKLVATVGPGFTINVRDASGARVTRLDPGAYDIEVHDLSVEHNFRLTGPGVNRATEVEDTGTVTWNVTLANGTYVFQCDPHAPMMNGSVAVGNVSTPPPPPPGGGGGGSGGSGGAITAKTKLTLTSGPGYAISLRTAAGKAVRSMRTGTYTVTVRDRSAIHNAHLVGPGYNRATRPVSYRGTQTWKVRLARTGTLRFLCDPHAAQMKGSARIVRGA